MIVNVEKNWNEEIKNVLSTQKEYIQNKHNEFYNILSRGMLYPKEFTKERVVFLGINPSFREGKDPGFGFNEIVYEDEIFKKEAKEMYVFFKVFEKAFGDLPWTHFDMLPFRERNQKLISKYFDDKTPFVVDVLTKFIGISKEIIEESSPKILIVSNAYVRNMFSFGNSEENSNAWQVFKTKFSKEIGTHIITEGKLENTPVFFTSMLSGQRAMDVGSRQRLDWHIRMILSGKLKI
jgi:hypothetical protein